MKWGDAVSKILGALTDLGPMTRAELVDHFPEMANTISAVITRLTKESARGPKRVHITDYTYDAEGLRRYPRAIYAIGDKPSARKPKVDKNATRRANRKARSRKVNSVWMLAVPQRDRARVSRQGVFT